MEELIKDILFYTATISGSICIILLFLCAVFRVFCIFLDHCKIANVLKECLKIYIKQKNPTYKVEAENIDFTRQRVHLRKKEE